MITEKEEAPDDGSYLFLLTSQSPSNVSGYNVLLYLRVRYALVYIYSNAAKVVPTLSHTVVTAKPFYHFLVNPMARLTHPVLLMLCLFGKI